MIQELSDTERPLPIFPPSSESMPVMQSPLLHTKLHIPGATPTLLSRPRLISQLHFESNGCFTLLSAPAGFGKTTLVTDWLRQQNNSVAWLTLDEQDNDPVLFWRYLIAALQMVDERLGLRAQAALAALRGISLETAVTFIINDIVSHIPADQTMTACFGRFPLDS